MIKQLFNYYIILKTCWIILFFQFVGFVALVVMEQGKDILQALDLFAPAPIFAHTYFVMIAGLWWSWQSWRSARVILHFTRFDFVHYSENYAKRAQVVVPRLLGVLPLLILTYGIWRVTGWSNPLVWIHLSLALWIYVIFHLRKDIIVYFLSRNKLRFLHIPEYIMVKNDAYPARFVWQKQGRWIGFRFMLIVLVFTLVVIYPVQIPQMLGAAGLILFALGAWLVIATVLDYAEKRFRFPFTFSVIAMVIGFSFFNNNHSIRTLNDINLENRLSLESHFDEWYSKRYATHFGNDSVPVILVAGQGGGVRSAYWTAQVLSKIQQELPQFNDHVYAYSSVSGGSLGVAVFKQLVAQNEENLCDVSHEMLSKDFLSPVTSWLVIPDLVQKFLPFPIHRFDRARALEKSWEDAAEYNGTSLLSSGFIDQFGSDESLYMFNSTRVENGFRTLLSNIKIDSQVFSRTEDFFKVTQTDVPLSTAISVSSRFPFITPPALVKDAQGKKWGHLVDGGYVENMGATAMIDVYEALKVHSQKQGYKTKFHLVFIKNTKEEYNTQITGLHELLGPLNTFSKVWVNSGYYDPQHSIVKSLPSSDRAVFISLEREEDKLIPLGWYLSPQAANHLRNQVSKQTEEYVRDLSVLLPLENTNKAITIN